MAQAFAAPAWSALLSALRCPACGGHGARLEPRRSSVVCKACGLGHEVVDGIVRINVTDLHPEVVQ
jgi:hypothetical protein